MKKKFIRVMFFGALALATGASFVGCKDYDDDIDAVNARVDGIEKTLSELQAQLGGYVKSVDYNSSTGVLTVVGGNNETFNLPMPKDMPEYTLEVTKDGKITLKKDGDVAGSGTIEIPEIPDIPAAFDPALLTVGEDGYIYYNKKKTEVKLPAEYTATSSIMAITNEKGDVTGYSITALTKDGKVTNATFSIIDALPLKGLVFRPDCYVDGVPSVKAYNLTYNAWGTGKNYEVSEDGEVFTKDENASYVTPQILAYYHMNPSSVTMAQIETLSFIADDKESYTRATEFAPKVDMEKSGVVTGEDKLNYLKVAMDADAEKIASKEDNEITVFALQAQTNVSDKKEVITSDYASVHKVDLKDVVLKVNIETVEGNEPRNVLVYGQTEARGERTEEYAGKAKEAIENEADFTVPKDKTLNLAERISAYYKEGDKTIELKNVTDLGLKYVYTASNYIKGNPDKTQQNTFINEADAAKGVVNPEYKGEESENTVGREPLIRVQLVTNDAAEKVVAVGWIKTKIKPASKAIEQEVALGTYNYGCATFDKMITYTDMNDVYHAAGLDKTSFHTIYSIVSAGKDGDDNAIATLAKGSTGKVVELGDAEATTSNILEWTVTEEDMAKLISEGTTSISAIVTYHSDVRGDVVITLKANIATPSGTIKNNKAENVWSDDLTYVRADVKEPTGTPVTEFTFDLYKAFMGNIEVEGVDAKNFPSFEELRTNFVFSEIKAVTIGEDKYTFTVENTENLNAEEVTSTLTATLNGKNAPQEIAKIVNTYKGEKYTAVVTYNKENEYAKVLLNQSAYNEKPFTAGIEIIETNECGQNLKLTSGNTFDVKFLRPINAVKVDGAKLQDATTNKATIDMSKLLKFTDWRGEDFLSAPDFFAYYGIDKAKGISIDKDEITTTYGNGTVVSYDQISDKISIDYSCAVYFDENGVITLGNITYSNSGLTVEKEYKLFIPVTVKYTFGSVFTTVELTITPTYDKK